MVWNFQTIIGQVQHIIHDPISPKNRTKSVKMDIDL